MLDSLFNQGKWLLLSGTLILSSRCDFVIVCKLTFLTFTWKRETEQKSNDVNDICKYRYESSICNHNSTKLSNFENLEFILQDFFLKQKTSFYPLEILYTKIDVIYSTVYL